MCTVIAHAVSCSGRGIWKKAKAGTPEFRVTLRDALEAAHEVVGAQGIFNMTAQNHNGMDQRSRLMMTVKNGKWVPLKD